MVNLFEKWIREEEKLISNSKFLKIFPDLEWTPSPTNLTEIAHFQVWPISIQINNNIVNENT